MNRYDVEITIVIDVTDCELNGVQALVGVGDEGCRIGHKRAGAHAYVNVRRISSAVDNIQITVVIDVTKHDGCRWVASYCQYGVLVFSEGRGAILSTSY